MPTLSSVAATLVVLAVVAAGGGGAGSDREAEALRAVAGHAVARNVAVAGEGVAGGVAAGDMATGGAVAPRATWQWPVRPKPPVLRRFVAPRSAWGPGHRGVDLGAASGTEVRAVDDGVVAHAGPVAGRGTVSVLHASGVRSTYEPVEPRVTVGSRVRRGDVVGVLAAGAGGSHCGPRSCLHLGARRAGAYLDPLVLLTGGRVVLLPLPSGFRPG